MAGEPVLRGQGPRTRRDRRAARRRPGLRDAGGRHANRLGHAAGLGSTRTVADDLGDRLGAYRGRADVHLARIVADTRVGGAQRMGEAAGRGTDGRLRTARWLPERLVRQGLDADPRAAGRGGGGMPVTPGHLLRGITSSTTSFAQRSPIDYARRRRLPRLAQAQLAVTAWRRQGHILRHPATWGQPQQPDETTLPADPAREHAACAGKPAPCSPRPASTSPSPGNPRPAGSPASPGPAPTASPSATCTRSSRARLPASAIAARLATTADHVQLAAARNPAPRLPARSPAGVPPHPGYPPPQPDHDAKVHA